MSVNFSTITPMNQSTISKPPAFSTAQTAAQPAASSPMDANHQPTKKSHWFRNTLIAAAILVGGATLLRGKVEMFKDFDKTIKLADDAKFMDKAAHYGKKGVAAVGDFIMTQANKVIAWGKGIFKTAEKTASNPPAPPVA